MLLIISTVILILIVLLYKYLTSNFDYWNKLGVDGPKPMILAGNFPHSLMRKRSLLYEIDDIYREYRGKGHEFVGIFNMTTPQLLLLETDLVHEVLVRNFNHFHDNEFHDLIDETADPILSRNPFVLAGEEWKEKRNEISPAFSPGRIRALEPIITDVSFKMTEYINQETKNKPTKPLEAKELCGRFSTDVVANCIFGIDAKSFTNTQEGGTIREMGKQLLHISFAHLIYFIITAIFPFIKKMYLMPLVPKKVENFFTNLMSDAIKLRQKANTDRQDYLNYLLHLKEKKNISNTDMAAHTVTFFVDGYETSSTVMSFMLYFIGKNRDIQLRVRQEINGITNSGGKINFEKLVELPYLEQVLAETLRLFSPLGLMSKKCTIPTELKGHNGKSVKLAHGTLVGIPVTSIHWDPQIYENPMKFDPDRFAPDKGGVKRFENEGKFLGFGMGPRICLGRRFAKAQIKVGFSHIIRNFDISVDGKTQEPIILDPKESFLVPQGGLWINFKQL